MNMLKKALVLLLACAMLLGTVACGGSSSSEASGSGTSAEGEAVDYRPAWSEYNSLIAQIKSSTDFVEREALMHQAEDILMETGAICPLYYYNDLFMAKDGLEGYYSNAYAVAESMNTVYADFPPLYWYNGNGTEDFSLDSQVSLVNMARTELTDCLTDGENMAFVVKEGSAHTYENWLTDLYNILIVFFN